MVDDIIREPNKQPRSAVSDVVADEDENLDPQEQAWLTHLLASQPVEVMPGQVWSRLEHTMAQLIKSAAIDHDIDAGEVAKCRMNPIKPLLDKQSRLEIGVEEG